MGWVRSGGRRVGVALAARAVPETTGVFVLARLFRAGSPRRSWGPAGGPWGSAVRVLVRSVGHGPLARGPWSACAPLLMSLSLCALCPIRLDRGRPHAGPGFGRGQRLLHPLASRGLLAASRRSTSTRGGRLGRAGSMRRVRPRCFSPARPLARPGWAGQHHPTSSSPHRCRCGCHRLVEEL